MNLLVIGNGFDLAHGLKTSYSDFLNICLGDETIYNFSEEEKELVNLIHSKDETFKNKMQNNPWVQFFLKRKDEIGKNWVDFEREIKRVCEIVSSEKDNAKHFHYNLYLLKDRNGNYLFEKNYSVVDRDYMKSTLTELIEMLNFYLCQLETLSINFYYQQIIDFGPTHVINFNYTSTFLKNYCSNAEIDFVHGRTGNDKNSIVLGFDTLESLEKDVEFAEFLKYFQMVNNDIEMKIHLNSKLNEIHAIVFGHSLDKTDEDIIKDIIDNSSRVTLIYYSDGHKVQMIKNLIKIYGKNKFNQLCLTKGKKKVYFVRQERPVKCTPYIQKTYDLFLKVINRSAVEEEIIKFYKEKRFLDFKTNEENWFTIANIFYEKINLFSYKEAIELTEQFVKILEPYASNQSYHITIERLCNVPKRYRFLEKTQVYKN